MWKLVIATLAALSLTAHSAEPEYVVVFEGYPTRKTETGPDMILERPLSPKETYEYVARIVMDSKGNHFWQSREMKPMVKVLSGSYVTYANPAGYVRTYIDGILDMKREGIDSTAATIMGLDHPYEYVEHIYVYFAGINYYGERRDR